VKTDFSSPIPTFFIIGLPRSGTTLLETILDSHSEMAVSPEIFTGRVLWRLNSASTISDRWKSLLILNSQYRLSNHFIDPIGQCIAKQAVREISFPIAAPIYFALLAHEYITLKKAKIFGEKTPENTYFLKTLNKAFPNSKYIVILRNPFDIVLSISEATSLKLQVPITNDLLLRSAVFVKRGLFELFIKKRLAHRETVWITYEDLVCRPEQILNKIYNFLGVDNEDHRLTFQQKKRFISNDEILNTIHQYLRKPITTDRINRSFDRLTPEQLKLLYKYLTPEINYLPFTFPPNSTKLSARNKLRLIVANFAFNIRWHMVEELKNKLRFMLHHFAICCFRNSPMRSFIFKNLIHSNEQWEKILKESNKESK
jgi:hypothetical protein